MLSTPAMLKKQLERTASFSDEPCTSGLRLVRLLFRNDALVMGDIVLRQRHFTYTQSGG